MAKSDKTDRRVRYTKAALREALVAQMQDRHISAITVKSLCRQADVNRSTFYLHYRNQFDLLKQVEEEMIDDLRRRLDNQLDTEGAGPVSLRTMTEVMEYARENSALARALLSENSGIGFKQDVMQLTPMFSDSVAVGYDPRTRAYIATYCIDGAIAMVEKWLRDGSIETPRQIAELLVQMVFGSVASFSE
ncbi:MAG: TetR family transcriptional regulator C-terminal domain-containing protein [Coriobacteriales bacterium]|jgi:AcrR family transcriptional regulator|nr:TetR family transcriptional regulator C-terminal domain-containing protein [Coriobacteriales bacterium]